MAQNVFQFFLEPGLQELFRDKDTGLPLSDGRVEFYRDKARAEPKPVYKLTGAPDDPIYVPLPNPITLTGIGSSSDGASNDIKWYYNPFDDNGNVDLYYIRVFNSAGVEQFTREGWPQQIPSQDDFSLSFVENYFQDSQFLWHIDIPNNGLIQPGDQITNLSYGGWVFVLPPGFTSLNTVIFDRFSGYVQNPTVSPRYACRVSTTNPNAAETVKDLIWVNNNVNFLSERTVTLQFEAISNNGVPTLVEVFYEKIYGSGGSPSDIVFVNSFTIDFTDWAKYTTSFTITDNLGKNIGTNDDDEIRFIIRMPTDIVIDLSFVNFVLTEGQFQVLTHPDTSDYQTKLNALASSIAGPEYDGSNAGDVLTLGGRTNTAIGSTGTPLANIQWLPSVPSGVISPYAGTTSPLGYLLCDGVSYDLVGPNSLDEYKRLFNVISTNFGFGVDTYLAVKTGVAQFTMTCTREGVASLPNPFTSGFTMNVTIAGGPFDRQEVTVDTIDALLIPPGSYFQIFSQTGRSSVYWFEIDGVGSDPSISFPGSLVKKIILSSSDTADQVADNIVANAITEIQVPDLRGMFLRGVDNGRGLDPDSSTRLDPTFQSVIGDVVGSVQYDSIQNHQHTVQIPSGSLVIGSGPDHRTFISGDTGLIDPALPAGNVARISTETRSINTYVNYIIKT